MTNFKNPIEKKMSDDEFELKETELEDNIINENKNFFQEKPGYDDYKTAMSLKVPVYSIGPTTVSVITYGSIYNQEADFDKISLETYKDMLIGVSVNCNPFYWRLTTNWLDEPEIVTAKSK